MKKIKKLKLSVFILIITATAALLYLTILRKLIGLFTIVGFMITAMLMPKLSDFEEKK